MEKLLENLEKIVKHNIIIILLFFIFLCFKLIFQVPVLNDGGDEAGQWFLALDILNENYDRFNSLHHNLRWANWMPSILIGIFNQSYEGYYIFNFLRSTIGFFIFYFLIAKVFTPLTAIVFLFLIFFDHDLMLFYFELNPLMTAIFYLSIIFLLVYLKKDKIFEGYNLFLIILLFFFLYGAKLPFIFFFVGFSYFALQLKGIKTFIKSIIIFGVFYIIETIIFNFFNPEFSNFGRIHEIAFNKTLHVNSMYDHFPNGMDITYIFERWLVNGNSIGYILGILMLCFLFNSKSEKFSILRNDINKQLLYYLGLAFFFCNTFFIISLKPFMMGQEHHTRYVAHLIFLLFPFIIYFFKYLLIKSSIILLPLYLAIFTIIFYPQFTYIYQFINKGQIIDYRSIVHQTNKYKKYSLIVEEQDCFLSNTKEGRLTITLNYFDRNNFKVFKDGDKWLAHRNGVNECKDYYLLDNMYNFIEY